MYLLFHFIHINNCILINFYCYNPDVLHLNENSVPGPNLCFKKKGLLILCLRSSELDGDTVFCMCPLNNFLVINIINVTLGL